MPLTRQQIIKAAKPLTVRIEDATCGSYSSGTGFVISPDLVVTVAHVVEGARDVSVRGLTGVSRGTVIGIDPQREVALIQTVREVAPGDGLQFATAEPEEGDEVVSVGYPKGRPQTATTGTITGLDRTLDLDDDRFEGLLQYNADTSPGNSGGPILDRLGMVVGLTEASYTDAEGAFYAVSGATAASLVQGWRNRPVPVRAPTCPSLGDTVVSYTSKHPDAPGISFFLRRYFDGINRRDATFLKQGDTELTGYQVAYNVLSGELKSTEGSVEQFISANTPYIMGDVVLEKADMLDDVRETADVSYKRLEFNGPDLSLGECVQHHYRYTLRLDTGSYKLDERRELPGNAASC